MYLKPVSIIRTAAIFAISLTGITYANQEQQPQAEIVLTVSGQNILGYEKEGSAAFSIDMLQALPSETFMTSTIWTEGVHQFKGVPLSTLLAQVKLIDGAEPVTLRARAANDYAINFPAPEADDLYPIVAYEMDRELMSLRDKGPLWIVYPFDTEKKYRTETIYTRSIWQLEEIEVLE
ncbi:hypothetical protein [Falsihalocynthiibacter arcticus]|uniref:hypothetical protein n=1 Tax=Falsihalocynthiibacter arcticus TaxID=1579316 RepID=UPI0005793D62|nr:hypothetical protein [Falsihalocynthiibacter arcticus]